MKSQIKFDKKFLEGIYKKLTGLVGRTPIHLMAVPGRMKNRLDLCDLSIAPAEADLDLFSGSNSKEKKDAFAKKFLEDLLTKDKFDFRFSWEDKKLTNADSDIKDKLIIVGKRLDSMTIDNEDSFIDTGLKNFGFGYPLLVLPDKKDNTKTIVAPVFLWSLDIQKSNRKNEWIISKNEDSPIKMNEILLSYIENTEKIRLEHLDPVDLDDCILQEDEIQKYLKNILQKLNIKYDDLKLRLEPVGTKDHLSKLCSGNGFIQWSGVFGLYRSQKETIIESVLELEKNIDQFNAEDLELERFSTSTEASFDLDPSQSEIIRTLNDNEFKIIQGPPGTGKSQAISAIISNSLANGAKTLVVCEKKTALDVLKHNLAEKDLDTFCVVVDDVNKDRKQVVEKARGLQTLNPYKSFNEVEFKKDQQTFNELKKKINDSYRASSETIFQDKAWSDLIGLYLQKSKRPSFDKIREDFGELVSRLAFEEKEFVDYCDLVKRGSDKRASSKHIDPEVFSIVDVNRLTDVSLTDKISIQKDMAASVKAIDEVLLYLKEHSVDVGTVSFGTKNNKIKTLIDKCAELQKEITAVLKSLKTFKNNSELQQIISVLNTINTDLHKVAKDSGAEIDGIDVIDSKEIKKLQSMEESVASVQQKVKNIHKQISALDKSEETQKAFVSNMMDLWTEEQNISNKFGCTCAKISLDTAVTDKIHKLHALLNHTKEIQDNYRDGEKVMGKSFATYNGNVFSRIFSSKAASAHKLSKDMWKAYSDIVTVYEMYLKKNPKLSISLIDEKSELGDLNKFSVKTAETLKKELNNVCKALQNTYDILEKNAKIIYDSLEMNKKELETNINSINLELDSRSSDIDNLYEFLMAIDRGQKLYEEVSQNMLEKFAGLSVEDFKYETTEDCKQVLHTIKNKIADLDEHLDELEIYLDWLQTYKLDEQLFDCLRYEEDEKYWSDSFQAAYYFYFLLDHSKKTKKSFLTSAKENDLGILRDLFVKLNKNNTKKIFNVWYSRRENAISYIDSKYGFKTLFALKRGKFAKKLSLRQIIEREFKAFTDLFPVVMVNPNVANALLPLKQGLFNLVVFDEASQLRIEDVYTSMIRGQYKIIAGDKHQMPPSNWFAKTADGATLNGDDDDSDDDDLSMSSLDAESLLEYAEGFKNVKEFASYLDFHYRSQHPALIEFSNCAFYGCNLCALPARVATESPFVYYNVAGTYFERTNEAEIDKVIEIIRNLPKMYKGELPSVGIATFNYQQQHAIRKKLFDTAAEDPNFAKIYAMLENHKDKLFVKNLETIQGDERDVIIISTTYGAGIDGRFKESFVINREEGYRLLNVLVTRAKKQLFLVTSIPENRFAEYKARLDEKQENNRIAIFYAYLAYVKAHASGDMVTVDAILKAVRENSKEQPRRDLGQTQEGLTESPFEEEVYEELLTILPKEKIKIQHKVGGYRLDFMLMLGDKKIALECDGKAYHSSEEAFAEDMHRQKILEGYGYKFYRIWSTNWFQNKEREVMKLRRFIEQESK